MKRLITSTLKWLDDRTGLGGIMGPPLMHLVPKDATWWYVFGSATLLAFIIQVASGIALAFSYIGSSSQAYDTLNYISDQAPLGSFLRGLHYYGASAMILMVAIHMVQVFLCGSYKYPREMNWVSGVLLLGLTVLMGFTGQLLRWDQTAVWSIIIAAQQAARLPFIGDYVAKFIMAGDTVSGATLGRFFAIHVFLVPGLIFAGIGLHLQLVLHNGISEMPRAGNPVNPKTYKEEYHAYLEKNGVPFWPWGMWRDVVFGTVMVVVICLLSLHWVPNSAYDQAAKDAPASHVTQTSGETHAVALASANQKSHSWLSEIPIPRLGYVDKEQAGAGWFGPPTIEKAPDLGDIVANPVPDWYLKWYFAVLALIPPATEDYVMILAPLVVGLILLLVPLRNSGERSPSRRPWAIGIVVIAVAGLGALTIQGVYEPWSPNFTPPPFSDAMIGAAKGSEVYRGAILFQKSGCVNCHTISGIGGHRGPELTNAGNFLTPYDMTIRITHGGTNMPAFGNLLKPGDLNAIVAFLTTRKDTNPFIKPKTAEK